LARPANGVPNGTSLSMPNSMPSSMRHSMPTTMPMSLPTSLPASLPAGLLPNAGLIHHTPGTGSLAMASMSQGVHNQAVSGMPPGMLPSGLPPGMLSGGMSGIAPGLPQGMSPTGTAPEPIVICKKCPKVALPKNYGFCQDHRTSRAKETCKSCSRPAVPKNYGFCDVHRARHADIFRAASGRLVPFSCALLATTNATLCAVWLSPPSAGSVHCYERAMSMLLVSSDPESKTRSTRGSFQPGW
jgi:hypothetical protein